MGHLLNMGIKMQKAASTTTTTTTSATITVNWFYDPFGCTTRNYAILKNGSTVSSGGGSTAASGSFTCIVGDVLEAQSTAGIKGASCSDTVSQIDRNGVTVASDYQAGFFVTAIATWTVTSGTTSVDMYTGLGAA
jgi:hypothetical protein